MILLEARTARSDGSHPFVFSHFHTVHLIDEVELISSINQPCKIQAQLQMVLDFSFHLATIKMTNCNIS